MHRRAMTAATLVAFFLLLAACQKAQETPAAADAPAAATAAEAAAAAAAPSEAAPTAVEPAEGEGISKLVALSTIGATKEFAERTLGESTYETPQDAQYMAGGCDVTLNFADDKSISKVSIALKKGCRFDAAQLAGLETPLLVDGPITFAQFEKLFGDAHYTSPCLRHCGNAYDPYVDAVIGGTRANGVIDVAAHAVFVSDSVLEASNAWEEKLMAKTGEEYVDSTKFNCESAHDDIPRAAFAASNVEAIEFGRELGSSDCGG